MSSESRTLPASRPCTAPVARARRRPGCTSATPSPASQKVDPILVADDVTRRFGGLTAVDVEHLEIPRGAITALIGPNGAGKTTLFNLLTRLRQARTRGTWSFDGKHLSRHPAYKVARMGQVRTFQLTKALGAADGAREHEARRDRADAASASGELIPAIWRKQDDEIEEQARWAAREVQARRQGRRLRREPLRRSAQAPRDGALAHDRADAGDARRADGRREPGAHRSRCSTTSSTSRTWA